MPKSEQLPPVYMTAPFRESLLQDGYDPDAYCTYFAEWKASGERGEYGDYYFGKDGFYEVPKRSGVRILRHVHLPPEGDEELARWERDFANRSRKTSNNVLLYTEDKRHGYLLLYWVREPHGHSLADMATAVTMRLMNDLADIADAFIHEGASSLASVD